MMLLPIIAIPSQRFVARISKMVSSRQPAQSLGAAQTIWRPLHINMNTFD
jgi:hypothetical protein